MIGIPGIPPRSVDFDLDLRLSYLVQLAGEPSDRITLKQITAQKLFEYWESRADCSQAMLDLEKSLGVEGAGPNPGGDCMIPADLVYAGTIPLRNVELELQYEDGSTCLSRVYFPKGSEKLLDESPEWKLWPVGFIQLKGLKQSDMWIPIETARGLGGLITIGHHIRATPGAPYPYLMPLPDSMLQDPNLAAAIENILINWYSIQISLMHPQIKKAYRIKEPSKKSAKAAAKTGRKRYTKLIRRYYIGLESIEEIEEANKRKYGRHCMAWYVCGHFRHYKNGAVRFIQGYWKGPLRELQTNLDEGRDRGLSLEGGVI